MAGIDGCRCSVRQEFNCALWLYHLWLYHAVARVVYTAAFWLKWLSVCCSFVLVEVVECGQIFFLLARGMIFCILA